MNMAFQSGSTKADESLRVVVVDGDCGYVNVIQPENENRGGFKRGSVKQQQPRGNFNPMIFGPAKFCCCGIDLKIESQIICLLQILLCFIELFSIDLVPIARLLMVCMHLYGISQKKPIWMLLNTIVEVLLAYILLITTVCCGLALVWIQAFGIEVEDGWRKFPGKYVEKDWIANRFRMNAEGFSLATILWILLLLVTVLQWHFASVLCSYYRKMRETSSSKNIPANGYVLHENV